MHLLVLNAENWWWEPITWFKKYILTQLMLILYICTNWLHRIDPWCCRGIIACMLRKFHSSVCWCWTYSLLAEAKAMAISSLCAPPQSKEVNLLHWDRGRHKPVLSTGAYVPLLCHLHVYIPLALPYFRSFVSIWSSLVHKSLVTELPEMGYLLCNTSSSL